MRSRLVCYVIGVLLATFSKAELPENLPELALWLRADRGVQADAEGRVSRWEDQSGKGNHLAAAGDEQPLLAAKAAGELPAIRFDGIDDALTLTGAPLPVAGRTIFAVVKWNQVRTYSFAIGCAEGTDGYLRMHDATSLLTGGRYLLLYQNGLAYPKVGRTPRDTSTPFHMGLNDLRQWNVYAIVETAEAKERLKYLGRNEANNTPQNRFIGDIAEVLVFDGTLSVAQRMAVEQYFGERYLGWPVAGVVPVRAEAPPASPRPAHGPTEQPLSAGRYRVHVNLTEVPQSGDRLVIRFGADSQTIALTPNSRGPHRADFVIPVGQPAAPRLVRARWEAPEVSAADADPLALDDPAVRDQAALTGLWVQSLSPVTVDDVQVDKILYEPEEPAVATAILRNYAEEPRQVEVHCLEVTGLDDRREVAVETLTVPPGETATLTVGYNVGPVEYGRELRVEVLADGWTLDAKGARYSVADNLWKVAIGAPSGGVIGSTAPYSLETIANQVRLARDGHCNWFEKSFWAPDDWGVLTTPPGATWYSGQARRHENTEKLQYLIATAHEVGMKAITYGKCMAGGLPGWELARARPQWFVVDAIGRTRGRPADVWDLEHWQEGDRYKYNDYTYVWTYRWVDLRRLDALDHGIDQLIASHRQFGWDGVRFDSGGFRAHFVPKDGQVIYNGVDSFNARNTRRMKERIWQELPDFVFGYNTNDPVAEAAGGGVSPLTPDAPAGHEFREMMAGGGLWMFEGMRERPTFWGRRPYKTWSDYATDMVQAIRTIKHYGGHVCFSYGTPDTYKFMIGTMIGAHDYVGEHQRAKGSADWGAFLTRWSSFIWDHRLRALPNADTVVTVESPRPLWWREFANELIVSPSKRYLVIHLMNPPINDEIAATGDELPEPVEGVSVHVVHGAERLMGARFIAPGYPDREVRLEAVVEEEGVARFALPRLDVWAMVVVELEGDYAPLPELPRLTEPLSPAELAEMEACKHIFNVPVADDLLNPTPHVDPELKPKDFGAPTVTMPADLMVGGKGKDVLLIKGFHHDSWRLPEALKEVGATIAECSARDLPRDYPDLVGYDVIVLIGMGADSWDANGHQRLADYVRAGGRLVVLGGAFTLGQGYFQGTALEAVLPVEVRVARDVYQLPEPLALGPAKGTAFPGQPLLYYYHAVRPRPDARAHLWAGELPIAWERTVELGTTAVFVGTTMGEAQAAGQQLFWQWEGWPKAAAALILNGRP